MGVDFTAMMSYRLPPEDLQYLPSSLSATTAPRLADAITHLLTVLMPLYPAIDTSLAWQFADHANSEVQAPEQVWARGMAIELEGPAGLLLDFGSQLCTIWNVTRWASFLTEPHRRLPLRQVCYELARILGVPMAIYLPDSGFPVSAVLDYVYTGQSIAEAVAWLESNHGLSAASIEAIYTEPDDMTWEGNAYFIDTFTDLNSASV